MCIEEYDINISPDKKEIIFKKPNTIYGVFKTFFEGYLEDQKACSKTV
jgi:DNA mismatch repair ATPase MutL